MSYKEPVELFALKNDKMHKSKEEIEKRREQEVKAAKDNIIAPEFLKVDLLPRFYYFADQLTQAKIMTNLDTDALARYVFAESEYERLSTELAKLKPVKSGRGGHPVVNDDYAKLLKSQDAMLKQAKSCGDALGLSIMARAKLIAPKVEEKVSDDPFDQIFDLKNKEVN